MKELLILRELYVLTYHQYNMDVILPAGLTALDCCFRNVFINLISLN